MLDPEQSEFTLLRELPPSRWMVMAHRSALSMFGAAKEPVRFAGAVAEWSSMWEAEKVARRLNRQTDKPHDVFYVPEVIPQ